MADFAEINDLALRRAERSIAVLEKLGLPTEDIPRMYFPESTLNLRLPLAVTDRFIACTILAGKGEGLPIQTSQGLLVHFEALEALIPDELQFLQDPAPSEESNRYYHWQQESAMVFAWANGLVEQLPEVGEAIPGSLPADTLGRGDSRDAIDKLVQPRALQEVLDVADLYYRLYHSLRPLFQAQKTNPPGLNYHVVYFRHIALSWLIGWYGRDWGALGIEF